MKRDFVDFSLVPEHQQAIHARLENWGLSQRNHEKRGISPGFEQYQSGNVWMTLEPKTVVDQKDAQRIAKGVRELPAKQALAVSWYYVKGTSPMRARKSIGVTAEGLAALVIDARQMLINRGV